MHNSIKDIDWRELHYIANALKKGRTYIPDPSKAPKGASVKRGPRGGYYYEESLVQSQKVQEESEPTNFKIKRYKDPVSEEWKCDLLSKFPHQTKWNIYYKKQAPDFLEELLRENHKIQIKDVPTEDYVWDTKDKPRFKRRKTIVPKK